MSAPFYSRRHLDFLLDEVHRAYGLLEYPRYAHLNRGELELMLNATGQLAESRLLPLLRPMDREEPQLVEGRIRVHPEVRPLMQTFGEGGWIAAMAPLELGGMQLPIVFSNAFLFVFGAANYSAAAFPYLSAGASNLLVSFGSPEQQQRFLPRLFSGQWQGTMALTEPEAGSSLADLKTTAYPQPDGSYRIKGQKIYISAGDHDAVDNIVHLMLARIEGAPAGTRGISLFVVPRHREERGQLLDNDVQTAGVYHKMGYKGAPIAHLMLGERGDCRAELVGEPNQGLNYMFQMMNEARIAVGLNAVSIASAAYGASREYTATRRQGRAAGSRDPLSPPLPIEQHADVKRMLLFQKSVVEGCLSLLVQCGIWADQIKAGGESEARRAERLLDLLTPVAKSYPAEACIHSISAGLQCLGGAGYCRDYILEQFYREARIHPIHEGTTGIHGMDLLGRKIARDQGATLAEFVALVEADLNAASQQEALRPFADSLRSTLRQLTSTTQQLALRAMREGAESFLADATLYLEAFGLCAVAWQWIKMGSLACGREEAFYQGKMACMRYFIEYELPRCEGLFRRLNSSDRVTLETQPEWLD
jgi:alkylation response protein AidB-like acyl-CoA dehydrogenase